MLERRASLFELIEDGIPVWAMGAYDVLSAKVIDAAGFNAIGLQSLQMALSRGLPDIGVVGPDELVRMCREIRRVSDLPIIVDFEQGFGEPYASVYWMKQLADAGASAIHIDDYGLPYKCPFIPPHVMGLESRDQTANRIRAMVGERPRTDFMIIGRAGTYVANIAPDEEARRADWLDRSERYLEAGADALFPVGWEVSQLEWFRKAVTCPLITIRTLGTETMTEGRVQYSRGVMELTVPEIFGLGYQIYIEPSTLMGVAVSAMQEASGQILDAGTSAVVAHQHGNLYDFLDKWTDVPEVRRIRQKYS